MTTSKIQDVTVDINGNPLSWQNDPSIRKEGTKIPITKEHLFEIRKCKKDPIYFIENYCYINDPDKGRSIIQLYDWQKDLILHLKENKFCILMLPRQSGKSQTTALFLLWYMLFYADITSALLANKALIAREIFIRVSDAYHELPHFLKGGVRKLNESQLFIDNGSRVIAAATSKSGIRGYMINGALVIDETAFIDANKFEEFYTSVYPHYN